MITEIQSMAAKLREQEDKDEGVGGEEVIDKEAEMASRRVFDEELNEADFRKTKVTESK